MGDFEADIIHRVNHIMKSKYFNKVVYTATDNLNEVSEKKIKSIIQNCIYELLRIVFDPENKSKIAAIEKTYEIDLDLDINQVAVQLNIIIITCFDLACKTILDYDERSEKYYLISWLNQYLGIANQTILRKILKYANKLELFILQETEWKSCYLTLKNLEA